jgi:CBS domain containing-hemolysin-like protein
VLRILGSKSNNQFQTIKESIVAPPTDAVFATEEKNIVSRVLQLSSNQIRSVMTARPDVETIDLSKPKDEILQEIANATHSHLVAYKDGDKDKPIGVISKSDVLNQLITNYDEFDLTSMVRQVLCLPETISVLKALEEVKKAKIHVVLVVDEFGMYQGLATLKDILEEIAGDLPEMSETGECEVLENSTFMVKGEINLTELERQTGFTVNKDSHYNSLAGYILDIYQQVPEVDTVIEVEGWSLRIVSVRNLSVEKIELKKLEKVPVKE